MGRINPLIALGLPTWGKVSVTWSRAYRHLGGPLGSTMVELEPVVGRPIAEARNTLMKQAIASGAEFLFMLGDDVLCPGNMISSMLGTLRNHPEIALLTGVYWTREWPTSPYLWRGMQRGPFYDWKAGELLKVDYAGCDALMIRLSDAVKALGPEWFSTTWRWEPGQEIANLATEDFYFYTRARSKGIKLWCDTGLQCVHEDRNTGEQFGLTVEMPQAGGAVPELPTREDGGPIKVADLGCGNDTPYFGPPGTVVVTRIDIGEENSPDLRADLRNIPVPDGTFDIVHSRHSLEHFGRAELVPLVKEWVRILRVGGELRINVPNLLSAMKWIIDMEEGRAAPHPYAFWQLYGQQDDEFDVHKNGFTPKRLELLLTMPCFGLGDVHVEEVDDGQNLQATAVRERIVESWALTPEWDAIAEAEHLAVDGLAPVAHEVDGIVEHAGDQALVGAGQGA